MHIIVIFLLLLNRISVPNGVIENHKNYNFLLTTVLYTGSSIFRQFPKRFTEQYCSSSDTPIIHKYRNKIIIKQ